LDAPEPGTLDYQILTQFLLNEVELTPREIATSLNIPHSTVNSVIKRLGEKGFLNWRRYGDIELTEHGKDALKHIEVHFHLIEVFLVESLGLSPKEAQNEARELAPHVSCMLIKKICEKYGKPRTCPMNNTIPDYPGCHSHDT